MTHKQDLCKKHGLPFILASLDYDNGTRWCKECVEENEENEERRQLNNEPIELQ